MQYRLVGMKRVPFTPNYFTKEADQALRKIISILNTANAVAEHITTLTWYITKRKEYLASLKSLGYKYREEVG